MLPVWILVILCAVLIGLFSPADDYLTWLPIVFAGAVLGAFATQLAIQKKEGFVFRVMATITGALIALAAASAILGAIA